MSPGVADPPPTGGASPSEIPSRIGPFRILEPLGRGGMGLVYRAEHLETGEPVAVKTVLVPDETYLASLRREIHALIRVRHPGIVRFLLQGVDEGMPWYAMEILEGSTLNDSLRESAKTATMGYLDAPELDATLSLSMEAAELIRTERQRALVGHAPDNLADRLQLVRRICEPLAFLHGIGIVHRDLKPENIYVRPQGDPVLTDFGLMSRPTSPEGREVLEEGGVVAGTPAYMAPEQVRGESVDPRADLYSLGCILYEMVTGSLPFRARSPAHLMQLHLNSEPEPPSVRAPGLPPEVDRLVLGLLEKDRRYRIGHADDVALELERLGAEPEDRAGEEPPRAYLYRPEMAGRRNHRERLSRHLEDTKSNKGSFVLISGESGVGKTFLATATTATARRQHMRVVTGECIPIGSDAEGNGGLNAGPLHPLRPLLQSIVDHCLASGPEVTAELLGARARILRAYEESLGELPGLEDFPEPAPLPPEAARNRLLSALGEVLAAFSDIRPVLLVIDDLQWGDRLTLDFLASLPAEFFEERALMILGTFRSDERTSALSDLAVSDWVEELPLDRLDEDSLGTIVADMLALREPPRDLVEFLAHHSEGNPFFVAEYLRAAVAEGMLYRARGQWRVQEGEGEGGGYQSLQLPHSLRDLVGRRLKGLSFATREILDHAAVLGREFDLRTLRTAAGVDEAETFDPLSELIERQVVEQRSSGEIRFLHDKIRETTYARIPASRQRDLHRASAVALETLYGDDPSFVLRSAELAHHWKVGDEPARSIDYLERAGEHALGISAYGDAARLFADAVELGRGSELPYDELRVGRWERQIGEACLGLDDHAGGRQHLRRAVATLGWPMPGGRLGLGIGIVRQIGVQSALRLGLTKRSAKGVGSARLTEGGRAYDLLQVACRFTGEAPQILYSALRSLNLAERGGRPSAVAMAFALTHVLVGSFGLRRLAKKYADLSLEALAEADDPQARTFVLMMFCVYDMGVGRWDRVARNSTEAAEIADRIGFRRRWEETKYCLALSFFNRGYHTVAQTHLEQMHESAQRGAERHRSWALCFLGLIAVRTGDRTEADRLQRALADLPLAKLDQVDVAMIHSATALLLLFTGDVERARQSALLAHQVVAKIPPVMLEIGPACSWLAEVATALWQREVDDPQGTADSSTVRLAKWSIKRTEKLARLFPQMKAESLYWQGEAEVLHGKPERARRLWSACIDHCSDREMLYHEARAHVALARLDGESEHHSRLAEELRAQMESPRATESE